MSHEEHIILRADPTPSLQWIIRLPASSLSPRALFCFSSLPGGWVDQYRRRPYPVPGRQHPSCRSSTRIRPKARPAGTLTPLPPG